jgi:curved DNA-binding protein CbpA
VKLHLIFTLLILVTHPGFFASAEEVPHGDLNHDNPFERFKLSPDATDAEIKARYRALARKYHPDLAPPGEKDFYTAAFQKINDTNECLTNPRCRGLQSFEKFKSNFRGSTHHYSAKDVEVGSQEFYPFDLIPQTDEVTHEMRWKRFVEMNDQYFALSMSPPRHPLTTPKAFSKYQGVFSAGNEASRRSAWLTVIESLPDHFSSAKEAKIEADAFAALVVRRGQFKYLGDMSEAQTKKAFQLLYTSEPRLAWVTLAQKIELSSFLNPEEGHRLLLFALSNAAPQSKIDQNGIARLINSYAEGIRDEIGSKELHLKNLANAWDDHKIIGDQLTRKGILKRFDEFQDSRYSLNKFMNPKLEKRVLARLTDSMETLGAYSPRARENFKNFLVGNEKILSPDWLQKLEKTAVHPALGVAPISHAGSAPVVEGLAPIDTLDDYFKNLPEKKPSLWQCFKGVFN